MVLRSSVATAEGSGGWRGKKAASMSWAWRAPGVSEGGSRGMRRELGSGISW